MCVGTRSEVYKDCPCEPTGAGCRESFVQDPEVVVVSGRDGKGRGDAYSDLGGGEGGEPSNRGWEGGSQGSEGRETPSRGPKGGEMSSQGRRGYTRVP